ncbi:MAG: hypothetical protein K0U36_05415 [Alphaproteobacteria bacterium]|nr:hypothetical protein [Alphaproteobacteria bacterium]
MNATNGTVDSDATWRSRLLVDLLQTRTNSRILHPTYGIDFDSWLDAPLNGETISGIVADIAAACYTWLPEFQLNQVTVTDAGAGRLQLDVAGWWQSSPLSVQATTG